ncbi:hypothetical protein [Rhodococcus tukisamuensis]|uniref:Alkaline shock response membrane anchor protein AmaP n=1 Tax=Rhodococcus tukisamuensis TaxID=168276 RepID=A0A1G6ZSK9_9NOCA|nr:hypothetical protein [Rhodococcus tukisamuensis]SDE04546.1 hypothetical protein SAMN05444580_10986 [Rhodococcus tukisamuensis]
MKRRTVLADRLVVLTTGCLLLAGGVLAVTWRAGLDASVELVRRFDRARVAAAPDADWWPTALAVTCVVCVLVGVSLLTINLRRGRTSTVQVRTAALGVDNAGSELSVDLSPMAVGLAAELSALPGVRSVRSAAVDDRGRPTLRVTVTADPTVDLVEFNRDAEAMALSMAAALPGAPVATQVLLHLDPADSPS